MNKEKFFAYALLFVVFMLVQKSLVTILFGGRHVPDIVLMLVLTLAIIDGFEAFFPWAIGAGLLWDIASGSTPGLHGLIFVLVAYGVSFFSRRLLVDMRSTGAAMFAGFALGATLVSNILIAAWIAVENQSARIFFGALGSGTDLAITAAYNILVFMLLFFIARKITRKHTVLIQR